MARAEYIVTKGQKFAFWTVIDFAPFHTGAPKVLCRCICNKEKEVSIRNLVTGKSNSCGCARGCKTEEEYKERKFRSRPRIKSGTRKVLHR